MTSYMRETLMNYYKDLWDKQGRQCAGCSKPGGEVLEMACILPEDGDGDPIFYCQPCGAQVMDDYLNEDVVEDGFDWDEDTLWLLEDLTCNSVRWPLGFHLHPRATA